MKNYPEISKAEFDILKILWKKNPLSVREVHEAVKDTQNWAYSTTKTMMDRMVQKKLLKREPFHHIFLYFPLISKTQGLVKWIQFFADHVLETDYSSIVSMFGKSKALTRDEIAELNQIMKLYYNKHNN